MVRDSFSGVPTQNLRAFATCGRLRPCGCVRGVRVRAGVHVFARVCGRARLYGCVRARAPAQSVRQISLLLASQAASGGSCEYNIQHGTSHLLAPGAQHLGRAAEPDARSL